MFADDNRGQVSFEYLLTIVFAILLVIIVTIFALNLRSLANSVQAKIENYKETFFKNIFG